MYLLEMHLVEMHFSFVYITCMMALIMYVNDDNSLLSSPLQFVCSVLFASKLHACISYVHVQS